MNDCEKKKINCTLLSLDHFCLIFLNPSMYLGKNWNCVFWNTSYLCTMFSYETLQLHYEVCHYNHGPKCEINEKYCTGLSQILQVIYKLYEFYESSGPDITLKNVVTMVYLQRKLVSVNQFVLDSSTEKTDAETNIFHTFLFRLFFYVFVEILQKWEVALVIFTPYKIIATKPKIPACIIWQ